MHIIIHVHVVLLQIIDAVMQTEDTVGSINAITDSEMVCCKKSDCIITVTVIAEAWNK